jgi:hypothetical protein
MKLLLARRIPVILDGPGHNYADDDYDAKLTAQERASFASLTPDNQ